MSVEGYKKGKTRRQRAKLKLHRGIDGRIKTSGKKDDDIGDVWAQQERIRLAAAIEEDKRRKDRKELKRQRGIVGVARKDTSTITYKIKRELFGEQAANKPSLLDKLRAVREQKSINKQETTHEQEPADIHALLSQVKLLKPSRGSRLKSSVHKYVGPLAKIGFAAGALAGVGCIILVGMYIFHLSYAHYQRTHLKEYGASVANPAKINVKDKPQPVGPTQNNNIIKLVPGGRSINDYGGWYASSIPKIGSLYNYKDKINGVVFVVGQQTLVSQQGNDPDIIAKQVARYFNANRVITADGNTIYIGSSNQKFQTVVFTKDQTLVLIAAAGQLPDSIWASYANFLRPSS